MNNRSHNPLMIRIVPVCVAVFLCLQLVNAQHISGLDKDSLRRQITTMTADTNKIKAFLQLGEEYSLNLPDSAVKYLDEADTLSKQLNYPTGMIRYRFLYSGVLEMQGRFEEALKLSLEAADLAKKNNLKHLYAIALTNAATDYQYNDQYAMAAEYNLKALPLLEAEHNPNLDVIYGNLSGVYNLLRQPDKALVYARKSVVAAEQKNNTDAKGAAYGNLGNILYSLNKLDESIKYSKMAFRAATEAEDKYLEAVSLLNAGGAYTEKKEYENADAAHKRALSVAEALNDPRIKSELLYSIAKSSFRQKKIHQAGACLDTAIRYAQNHDQKSTLSKMLSLMSDVQIAAGSIDRYVRYRNQYDSLNIALLNEPLLKNVQELETKYKVAKSQSELLAQKLLVAQKTKETLRQRTWLVVLAGGILLLGLALFGGYRSYRHWQQLNARELEAANAERENVRLKASLDGQLQERQRISREMHDDMGSGLTSMLFMSRMVPGEAAQKINHTAAELVQKMNEIIWTMNHEDDTLDSLFAYLRAHIVDKLEEVGIAYSFTAAQPIPSLPISQEWRRNVYLTVKEAIHNIVKHAHATQVDITLQIDGAFRIAIYDNGRGIPSKELYHFGNGLKNMKFRMDSLGGSFEIQSDKGTCILLQLPLPAYVRTGTVAENAGRI